MATEALRELFTRFVTEFDSKELEKGNDLVDGMVDKLKSFGKGLVAAFAIDQVVSFGKEILADADALAKQSQALGISAQDLQGWQHAADLSGSSAGEFGAALTKFTRNVNEASEAATGPAAKAFKELGVSITDSTGKLGAPIDLLDGVVAGLQNIQDPAKRTAIVMDLFGKSGAKLLPLFSEGTEGIRKLRAEVGELGASFDDAFLANAQEVNDNVDRLKLGLKGLFVQAIGPLLPGMVEITQMLVSGAKSFIGWIRGGRMLQSAFAVLASNGIYKLLTAVPALVARFGGFRAVMLRLGAVLARFIAPMLVLEDIIVFLSGGKSAIGRGLDAAFGPGTAKNIQNLVAEMVKFFGLFKAEPDKVRAAFVNLPRDLKEIFGSFGTFLGEWGQAIVDVGLFVTNALSGGWANFVSKAKAAFDGYLLVWKIILTELQFAGLSAAAALSDAFDAAWSSILTGANAALNAIADVLAALPGSTDAADALRRTGSNLVEGAPQGGAVANIDKLREKARFALAAESDRIGAAATAPAGSTATSNVTNNTEVHVTVPPGTPADMAKSVAGATAGAVQKTNLRAAKAALVPTAG